MNWQIKFIPEAKKDYDRLAGTQQMQKQAEDKKYILIERLAGAICEDLFAQFPPIQSIKVRITKENPPINGHYKSVGIELERSR